MILHSFYSFDYILKLPLANITRLLVKAKVKENEDRLYQQWVINHATEFSFKEFKDEIKKIIEEKKEMEIDKSKTKEEIMEDVTNILNQFRR